VCTLEDADLTGMSKQRYQRSLSAAQYQTAPTSVTLSFRQDTSRPKLAIEGNTTSTFMRNDIALESRATLGIICLQIWKVCQPVNGAQILSDNFSHRPRS